jgi:hypothetical protein
MLVQGIPKIHGYSTYIIRINDWPQLCPIGVYVL